MRQENVKIQFFQGASQEHQDLALRYWTQDGNGGFLESVQALADETGRSQPHFLELIRKCSVAHLSHSQCSKCKEPIEVDSRRWLLRHLRSSEVICEACLFGRYDDGDVVATVSAVGDLRSKPIRIYADHMIDIESFQSDPQKTMQDFQGRSLVVMKDNKPLFYCVPPEAMT